MKCLKEPLAKMANRSESQTGAFWQARYKSIAVLDDEALLATCAYIDLNPVAAGIAKLPEESEHTSVKARVEHCREGGRIDDLQAARAGSAAAQQAEFGLEQGLWLCPLTDERESGSARAGVLSGLTLGGYLQLVDYTSRLVRRGKAKVSAEVASILSRLETSADAWCAAISRLFAGGRLLGAAFAFRRESLTAAAQKRGCHHIDNLSSSPA